jgi:DNA-binding protein YbaB
MTTSQDWIARVQADSLSRLEAVSEMQHKLHGLVAEASSPDRLVRVTVTPTGALVALDIDDQAMAMSGEQLAAAILDAIGRASIEAGARMKEIVGQVLPAGELDAMLRADVSQDTRDDVDAELRRRREAGA